MVRVKASYAFSGNPQESQLSFPAGAILEASSSNGGNHAPRNGWMHGRYEHQTGWFPESYVMVIDDSPLSLHGPPAGAPPPPPPAGQQQQQQAAVAGGGGGGEMPTVMAYSYQQENDITVTPLSPSAPPAVTAMPVPITSSTTTTTNEHLSFTTVPKKALREDQLSQLIQQGYTRGKCWSCMPYFLFLIQFSFSSRLLRSF